MEVSKLKPFDDNKSKFTLKDNYICVNMEDKSEGSYF